MRKKRTSKRRWKKRALLGMAIPRWAIVAHKLSQWRSWESASDYCAVYVIARGK